MKPSNSEVLDTFGQPYPGWLSVPPIRVKEIHRVTLAEAVEVGAAAEAHRVGGEEAGGLRVVVAGAEAVEAGRVDAQAAPGQGWGKKESVGELVALQRQGRVARQRPVSA